MKYYLHDSNSFNDEKITELYINYGYEGLGLFYTILEKLAMQEKPIKTTVLKSQLNVGKRLEKCWNFMEEIGIINTNNGETFNKQLLNYSENYKIKKEKNAKRILEWRNNQEDKKNVTHYENIHNTSKVNKSKVKEIKEEDIIQKKSTRFILPTIDEVKNYCLERKNDVDYEKWFNFYSAKGWMVGSNKMKDWKAAIRTWENNSKNGKTTDTNKQTAFKSSGTIDANDTSIFRGTPK